MKVGDYYGGNWLSHTDLGELDEAIVTIKDVTTADMEEEDGKEAKTKLAVEFEQFDKALVLNKTNATTLVGLFGDETDDWAGENVTLFIADVEWGGKMVSAIRIKPRQPKGKPIASQRKKKAKASSRAAKASTKTRRPAPVADNDDEADDE